MLSEFINSVMPTIGNLVVADNEKGKLSQRIIKSQEALEAVALAEQNAPYDCWFSPASYKRGWHEVEVGGAIRRKLRTRDNAWYVKALWLDVDVGGDKPYKTRGEAVSAIAGFIREVGLSRPWVVASGGCGLHIYFPLTEEVERDTWQELAVKLKQACKDKGLAADAVRTADVASIMRLPMTLNHKTNPPYRVEILLQGQEMELADAQQALAPFTLERVKQATERTEPINVRYSLSDVPVIDTKEITREALDRYFAPIKDIYPARHAPEVLAACEQLRNQRGAPEPVWRGMLATVRHCAHGRYVAHKISAVDARYDAVDTDRKLDYLKDAAIAPYTCDTFAALRPEVCGRCPLRGLIKSPISAPKPAHMEKNLTEEGATPTKAVADDAGTETEAAVVEPLYDAFTEADIQTRASRVNKSGCWILTVTGEGDKEWKCIHPYPVYPLQRIRGRTVKGETSISYIFRKYHSRGCDDIQIDGATLMGSTLNAALGNYGFLLNVKERGAMAGLLIDILKDAEDTLGEVHTTDRLGWNDTYDTFLLGNRVYKTDGKVFEIAVSGKAKPFCDITQPQGSLAEWKKIANVYNKKGLEWGQAVMASAFASPLMPLGSLEKAALLFITGGKGVGKSTALLMASSVYGAPDRLMFNKMDTPNSRFHKLGIYSNITAAFDEMTDLSPKEASEFAYALTQGRGKDRMGNGGEDMLLNTTYWACLPVMSANDSIITALSQHGQDPTAQMSRVLEIQATDINDYYTKEEAQTNERLVRSLVHNYGYAGDAYIRYITANKAEVLEMIYEIERRFREHTEVNSNHRFWSFMCTRMIVGLMIAKKLGLVDYDIANFFVYLVKLVRTSKVTINKYIYQPDSMVDTFLAASIPNRIVVTHDSRPDDIPDVPERGALNDINYVLQAPAHGREIVVRVALDTGNCTISIYAIRQWCKGAGVAFSAFMDALEDKFVVHSKRTRRDLGAQTNYRSSARIDCVVVNFPQQLLEDTEIIGD